MPFNPFPGRVFGKVRSVHASYMKRGAGIPPAPSLKTGKPGWIGALAADETTPNGGDSLYPIIPSCESQCQRGMPATEVAATTARSLPAEASLPASLYFDPRVRIGGCDIAPLDVPFAGRVCISGAGSTTMTPRGAARFLWISPGAGDGQPLSSGRRSRRR